MPPAYDHYTLTEPIGYVRNASFKVVTLIVIDFSGLNKAFKSVLKVSTTYENIDPEM